jgi:hypothetical protein
MACHQHACDHVSFISFTPTSLITGRIGKHRTKDASASLQNAAKSLRGDCPCLRQAKTFLNRQINISPEISVQ